MGAIAAAVVGLAGAGVSYAGAASARKANEASLAAEQDRISNLLAEIDIGRENATALREARDIPSELFAELVRKYPELLASILPQLTDQSIQTTDRLADVGSDQFLRLREKITPGAGKLDADRLTQINNLNPENLGAEEIASITRKLSPLIPQGTLDPSTGAVAGATTNPVSLYRNLISGAYNDRRTQFLGEARSFVGDANNAAARQQVSAADFLNSNLDRAFNTAAGLTSANIALQQADIEAQERYVLLASQGLASQYNPAANNQLIAQGYQGAIQGLGTAANAFSGGRGSNAKTQLG